MADWALIEELGLRGLRVTAQAVFPVAYRGQHIGTYVADLVVEDRLLWKSNVPIISAMSIWRNASTI